MTRNIYIGQRTRGGDHAAPSVIVWELDKRPDDTTRDLSPRRDLVDHSPDGFGWGYGGSGACQLALALLADATSDEVALRLYHRLVSEFVESITADNWMLPAVFLQTWARGVEAEARIDDLEERLDERRHL